MSPEDTTFENDTILSSETSQTGTQKPAKKLVQGGVVRQKQLILFFESTCCKNSLS